MFEIKDDSLIKIVQIVFDNNLKTIFILFVCNKVKQVHNNHKPVKLNNDHVLVNSLYILKNQAN
jgi:hypothetical protein